MPRALKGHRTVDPVEFLTELQARGPLSTRRRIAQKYDDFVDNLAREEVSRIGIAGPKGSPGSKGYIGSYARATAPKTAPSDKKKKAVGKR